MGGDPDRRRTPRRHHPQGRGHRPPARADGAAGGGRLSGPRVALVGPTAVGKSDVAIAVACRIGGEILSADSMQVYRGMDIGTAKPPARERDEVPHHIVDVADPAEHYSVAEFQAAAAAALERLAERPVILTGGTGLYVQAVVDDLELPGQFPEARAAVDGEPDTAALHRRLGELDPVAAARMEPTNRRRVTRALEVTLGSGRPFSSFGPGLDAYPETPWQLAGLDTDAAALDRQIEQRVDRMLGAGLVAETAALLARPGGLSRTARQALGYREVLLHLEGGAPLDEVRELIVRRTRRFARRQRSWFRRDPRIRWYDVGENPVDVVPVLLGDWGLT